MALSHPAFTGVSRQHLGDLLAPEGEKGNGGQLLCPGRGTQQVPQKSEAAVITPVLEPEPQALGQLRPADSRLVAPRIGSS